MTRVAAWLRSVADATVDLGLSVIGLLLVLLPTAGALHELLGSPIGTTTLELWALIAAIALAYPFVNRILSPGWLGTYVLAFWGGMVVTGVVGGAVITSTGMSPSGENPIWAGLLIAQGHAVALTITYLDDVALRPPRRPTAGEPQ